MRFALEQIARHEGCVSGLFRTRGFCVRSEHAIIWAPSPAQGCFSTELARTSGKKIHEEGTVSMRTHNTWLGLILAACACLSIALSFSFQVNAQLAGATLSGVVADESGAPIVGANVVIKNVDTGLLIALFEPNANLQPSHFLREGTTAGGRGTLLLPNTQLRS